MSKVRDKILEATDDMGKAELVQMIRNFVVWLSEDECEQFAKFAELFEDDGTDEADEEQGDEQAA